MIVGPLRNPLGANMGPKIDQVASKSSPKASVLLIYGRPRTDLFPESIRIEVLIIVRRVVIDLGSLFCNFVKCVDGLAAVLCTF